MVRFYVVKWGMFEINEATPCNAILGIRLINLTPHDISIHHEGGVIKVLKSGYVARVSEKKEVCAGLIQPTYTVTYGDIEVPDPVDGYVFVVSSVVLNALIEKGTTRDDIYAVGSPIRDEQGRPIGCDGLRAPFARVVF